MTTPLPGSERKPLPGARALGPADPKERLNVTIIVRRRAERELNARLTALAAGDRSIGILSREEFTNRHGADDADLKAVRDFAKLHSLSVVHESGARRTLVLSGTVAQFSAAFSVQLHRMTHASGTYRRRSGTISLPTELGGVVQAVLGLDDRPQARTHFRMRPGEAGHAKRGTAGKQDAAGRQAATDKQGAAGKQAATDTQDAASKQPGAASPVSYAPPQVAKVYGFPEGAGAGECVGLIELGGGFAPADLATYFGGLGVGSPKVTAVPVDGGSNAPTGDANGPDAEVMLDIEVVGSIAPQATVAVYFAPNTDAGFLDAVTTAIHDSVHAPSVISISWGGPESTWTSQALTAMDEAFQDAASLGITVCVASGDSGSTDGVASGEHVDFPASSSFALACGGTSLRASATSITSERVWNDGKNGGSSGGGISTFFAIPTWQAGLSAHRKSEGEAVRLTMRGVPDVSGDADPDTGYAVRVDGSDTVIGGTSAVAPLWASLIARINGAAGKPVGFINPLLYGNRAALRDITQGNNGYFEATAGWDACTGLGSPGSSLNSVL